VSERDVAAPTGRELAAIAAIVLLGALGLWLATRGSYFYADDYLDRVTARIPNFGLDYLKQPYFDHFSPGRRVLDKVVLARDTLSWPLAQAVLICAYAGAVAAYWLFARQVMSVRAALVTSGMVAAGVVFVRIAQWWAAGAQQIPYLTLSLVFLAAAAHWCRTRRAWALAVAVLSFAGALAFYEKAVLLGLVFAAVWYIAVPASAPRPRELLLRVRSDLALWIPVVGLLVAFTVIIKTGPYLTSGNRGSLEQWNQYLRVVWNRGTTPMILGQSIPYVTDTLEEAYVWLSQLLLLGIGLVTCLTRRRALRVWLVYLGLWIAFVALIGSGRLGTLGPGIGYDPRYNVEFVYLLPLALGLACSGPVRDSRLLARIPRLPGRALPALGVLLAVLFLLSAADGHRDVADAWPAGQAHSYLNRLSADVARLRARGLDPVFAADAPAPGALNPGQLSPVNTLPALLSAVDARLVKQSAGRRPVLVVVDDQGRVTIAR